jgi:hypothetical protein
VDVGVIKAAETMEVIVDLEREAMSFASRMSHQT